MSTWADRWVSLIPVMCNKGNRWLFYRSLFFSILVLVSLSACSDPFDKEKKNYEPWYFEAGPDLLYVLSDLVTKEHYDKVEKVLNYYCVEYRRVSPVNIEFIEPVTIDMIMNYRKKAEDQKWWAEHIEGQYRGCLDKQ